MQERFEKEHRVLSGLLELNAFGWALLLREGEELYVSHCNEHYLAQAGRSATEVCGQPLSCLGRLRFNARENVQNALFERHEVVVGDWIWECPGGKEKEVRFIALPSCCHGESVVFAMTAWKSLFGEVTAAKHGPPKYSP